VPFAQTAVRGKPPLSDHTQVIPRVPASASVPTAQAPSAAPAALTNGTALAAPYPLTSARFPTGPAPGGPDQNQISALVRTPFDGTAATTTNPGTSADVHPATAQDDELATAAAAPRHHRLVWVALVVFWALSLGAGLITLTSLGARASCSGSDKSLDCGNAGSAIAVVLTLCVIVLVGFVTVHAVEVRDRAKSWGRDLGLGVLVLVVVSFAAWRLILTING
jgi:hypothetical protein